MSCNGGLKKRASVMFLLLWLCGGSALNAQTGVASGPEVAVVENLGGFLPADIALTDEQGRHHTLGSLVDRPTLLLMVFFSCPVSCGLMTGNIVAALADVKADPAKDYRVLVVSFDEEDTTADALARRANHLDKLPAGFPVESFKFLTTDRQNIMALTRAMGYTFKKLGTHQFAHPNALLMVGKDRKMIRYLYGPRFLPFDILMAIQEARAEQPGISIPKLVSLCFEFDRGKNTYVAGVFRLFGLLMGILLTGFIGWLILGGRRADRAASTTADKE